MASAVQDLLPQVGSIDELIELLQQQAGIDPEQPTQQSSRLRAYCKVVIDGRDVTSIWDPHLISLEVDLLAAGGQSQAHITLDDRDATLSIPGEEAPCTIELGWMTEAMTVVLSGMIYEVESECFRKASGRILIITASGQSNLGKMKQRMHFSMGEGEKVDGQQGPQVSFGDFAQKVAGFAGVTLNIDSQFANVQRDFWHMAESPQQILERLSQELGGAFAMSGSTGSISPTIGNTSAGNVTAAWGVNLIGWRIRPYLAYPQYQEGKQNWFNIPQGTWNDAQQAFGGSLPFGQSTASATLPHAAPNDQVGGQRNTGITRNAQVMAGDGFVTINGEPTAFPNGTLTLTGARPGVDGTYTIFEVFHTYIRGGGFTTRIHVAAPQLGDYYTDQEKT